jgi:hypothetical protein
VTNHSLPSFVSTLGRAFFRNRRLKQRQQRNIEAQRQWLATAIEVETFLASWRGHYQASDLHLTERLYSQQRREYP